MLTNTTFPIKPTTASGFLPLLSRWWIYLAMGAAILALDWVSGPYLMFPVFFVIPIALSAWFYTAPCTIALTLLLPLGRVVIAAYIQQHTPPMYAVINGLIRVAVLGFIAYLVRRTARQTRELEKEVTLLEGILHICMFCKRIRDEDRGWEPLEGYISRKSEADFSHGLCPECAQKHYGDVLDRSRSR